MIRKFAIASLLAVSVLAAITVVAQNPAPSPLATKMEAFVVGVNAQGKEVMTRSNLVEPGQLIEYQMTYGNMSDRALSNMVITGPIPENTQYVQKSGSRIQGAPMTVSVDNGATFEKEPVKRVVTDEQGRKKTIILGPDQYTHLRWNDAGQLPAGTLQVYKYRVQVR